MAARRRRARRGSRVARPLTSAEIRRRKSVRAKGTFPRIPIRLGTHFLSVASGVLPEIVNRLSVIRGAGRDLMYRVDIETVGAHLQGKLKPARVPMKRFGARDFSARRAVQGKIDGFHPPFLDLHFVPRRTAAPALRRRVRKGSREFRPLLVFPPDRRYICDLSAFPWCTVGRVATPDSWGAGVMIGRWLMLTASHVLSWNSDGTSNWVTFSPAFAGAVAPQFGVANAVGGYAYRHNPRTGMSEFDVAEDYVVLVLDRPMGDQTGYMGFIEYTEDWDDTGYFSQIGYASDLGGGVQPSFQDQVAFSDADNPGIFGTGDGLDMESESCSLAGGDSGGPFFGWWDNEPWPRVIGVTSADGDGANWAGGGDPLVRMIQQARTDHP